MREVILLQKNCLDNLYRGLIAPPQHSIRKKLIPCYKLSEPPDYLHYRMNATYQ